MAKETIDILEKKLAEWQSKKDKIADLQPSPSKTWDFWSAVHMCKLLKEAIDAQKAADLANDKAEKAKIAMEHGIGFFC